ncbi:lipid A export permease/ATP-binding protein MsbA [Cardiobacteriaceae bacterium TAE3-ERU3]|nr:lipid A export permease/ATP-binding protein MsbA [Cardiobacteriaceae bacterium TAE3-ERU3]
MLNTEDRVRYIRLLRYVKPHWKIAVLTVLATIVYGLTEPLVPFVLKPLIDGGFAERDMTTVYAMVALLIGGFLIRGVANFTSAYASTWLAQRVVYTLRKQMFAHLLRLPMAYHNRHSNGEIVSRFTYDVLQLMSASTDAVMILVREIITIIALLSYLFYLNWKMTLMILSISPLLAFIITFISRRLRNLARAMQEDMSGMNHVVDESLRGREIVRIYHGEKFEKSRFDKQAYSVLKHALLSKKNLEIASPIIEMIIIGSLAVVIIIAANLAQTQPEQMTAGTFVAFLGTMALLFPPIKRLGKVVEPIQKGMAATQSIFDFLDTPTEPQKALPHKQIKHGSLTFENVSFSYGEHQVLNDFSLHIDAGETVALVGESGSGKSTIAALIAGFYQPDNGRILFDGIDTAEMTMQDRRRALALVTQQTVVFSSGIIDNIAYGDPEPDRERVIAAAKRANADGFIQRLPEKYDSHLGEQGGRLSGGQKQRIAIARALYKNAPILILDEATSALDNESEHKVQTAIDELRHGRTAIVIAHRLSTVRHADRIIVLNQGRIVESGSHDELLGENGVYAKLLAQNIH